MDLSRVDCGWTQQLREQVRQERSMVAQQQQFGQLVRYARFGLADVSTLLRKSARSLGTGGQRRACKYPAHFGRSRRQACVVRSYTRKKPMYRQREHMWLVRSRELQFTPISQRQRGERRKKTYSFHRQAPRSGDAWTSSIRNPTTCSLLEENTLLHAGAVGPTSVAAACLMYNQS